MSEYPFDPPLILRGKVVVRNLDDAATFARRYQRARPPVLQDSIVRQIERADLEDEQRNAADAFRAWVEAEGLLVNS